MFNNLHFDFHGNNVFDLCVDNTLEEIKSLYKKELIDQEMETEEFKKVLAKFPNAKIIDIEEIERGDDNDG